MSPAATLALAALSLTLAAPLGAAVIDKQAALDAQTWWDNRDWDWYKNHIPFFECPDPDITTTYYYRWELVTKHLVYGSPDTGYSFTEFTDRPFWSGTYGAISCPAGHQIYETRWLRDPRFVRDYTRYWFRTPGAQPRRYGTWLADAAWASHQVHPDENFLVDLLPDLLANDRGWTGRQFVPDVGLFWQNGHDDGMEFNINSRQTRDILRGADGYRPGFNAYMFADALAIARIARLAGDAETAQRYESRAASLKRLVEEKLWDPDRAFFFPMSMRDEQDADGNLVKKHTLTYQSGKFAGSPHGRELHGYVPWQFDLPGPGFSAAWKFLMDPDYFYADYGPSTVERHDPLFVLKDSCCWWSGQSWPFASAQTLKALANHLHRGDNTHVTRADYLKLLNIFARSHRKDGRPYLAEALHPDTGSFDGHDGYNHSEHYFHSSFNDLVITGLVGLKTGTGDTVEIDPLAPADWPYFALDDVPYHGHLLSIVWDKTGTRYGLGPGLHIIAGSKLIARADTLTKLTATLPPTVPLPSPQPPPQNFAVNNDLDYYPRLTATYTAGKTSLNKLCDGQYWYTIHPPNRWTTTGSPNEADSITLDFGTPRALHTIKLYFLDDTTDIVAPQSYTIDYHDGTGWKPVAAQSRSPQVPEGHRANTIGFPRIETAKLRFTFNHAAGARTGLTEIEAWGHGPLPYQPAPPPPGNLAVNMKGEGFPKATASFHDVYGGVPKNANDGRVNFLPNPVNRWTSYGSPSAQDWLEVDFGEPKTFNRAELLIYDDRGGVQPPARYTLQVPDGNGSWREVPGQKRQPETPVGSTNNTVTFPPTTATKLRVLFTNHGNARSGLTELEVWDDGE